MKETYRCQKQGENKKLGRDTSSKALEVSSEPSLVAAGSGVKKVGDEAKAPQSEEDNRKHPHRGVANSEELRP